MKWEFQNVNCFGHIFPALSLKSLVAGTAKCYAIPPTGNNEMLTADAGGTPAN